MQPTKQVPLTHRLAIRLPESPDSDGSPNMHVFSTVMQSLHRLWLILPQGLAVSFPRMQLTPGEIAWGLTIVIYSDVDGLMAVLDDPEAGDFLRANCRIGSMSRAGPAKSWVRYGRVDQPGAIDSSRIRRELRRMALPGTQGEAIRRNRLAQGIAAGCVTPGAAKVEAFPKVWLASSSTGRSFPLSASRQAAESPGNGLFGSFGLSDGGAVPE